jgi:hypothetical protein
MNLIIWAIISAISQVILGGQKFALEGYKLIFFIEGFFKIIEHY